MDIKVPITEARIRAWEVGLANERRGVQNRITPRLPRLVNEPCLVWGRDGEVIADVDTMQEGELHAFSLGASYGIFIMQDRLCYKA